MPSKYTDLTATIQTIGCIYNNPQILDMNDKYLIHDEDFSDNFHKIVFGAIYKLYESGTTKISLTNILDFLSNRPKSEAIFKQNKGEEWLAKASEVATPATFDYYYNRLKKFSLLRAYDNCGLDITDMYDADNILDIKKKQRQEEWLDNVTLEEIAGKVDEQIDNIRMTHVDNSFGEAKQAAEGIEELIQKFKDTPEVGVPLYGPLINTVTRGARLKKFYLRSAATGVGKAIPNDTLIPTPEGWKKVEDIHVGDVIFGQNGKPTKVVRVYPQPKKKEIWKVTFLDGRVAKCCGDHLWEYHYPSKHGWESQVANTRTIYEKFFAYKVEKPYWEPHQVYIRTNRAVEYPERIYPIPPYALGILLGSKILKENKFLTIVTSDKELLELLVESLGEEYSLYTRSKNPKDWRFMKNNKVVKLKDFFFTYPEVITGGRIPEDYLLGSIAQRTELMQGLMDAAGSVTGKKGQPVFTTLNEALQQDFLMLCRSLGYSATIFRKETKNTAIHISNEDRSHIFKRSAKKEELMQFNSGYNRMTTHMPIKGIEKTTEMADMTCFQVDNPDHLFLMNDYIVTHNTRSMIADVCYIGCNRIYDENFGWINTGRAEPVLLITTEQELEEIQTMMLAFLSNVNEEHILNGEYLEGEEERIHQAALYLKDSPIFVEELPDFSLQDVENTIKKNIREHDVKYVFDPIKRVTGQ